MAPFVAVRENRPDRIVVAGPDSAERISVVLSEKPFYNSIFRRHFKLAADIVRGKTDFRKKIT